MKKARAKSAKPELVQYFSTADLERIVRRHLEVEAAITSATRASFRWRWTVGRGPVLEMRLEVLPEVVDLKKWIDQLGKKDQGR